MFQVQLGEGGNTPVLYHLGYQGRTPDTLLAALLERGIKTLCDVRLSPRSRVPHWNKGRLSASCKQAGVRYAHVDALGNVLYREGGIELKDPELGMKELKALMAQGAVAVMCMCKSVSGCHRAEVLQLALEAIPDLTVVRV